MNRRLTAEVQEALERRWELVYHGRLHYAVSWSTRGRQRVLWQRHAETARELLEQACAEQGFTVVECVVAPEHMHLVLGLRPTQSVASAVRHLKERTGPQLMQTFPELRAWLHGNLLWDDRYSVETVSAVRLERMCERLRDTHEADEDLSAAS